MRVRLLAVGERQPGWVNDAVDSFRLRLPREWRFEVQEVPAARRTKSSPASRAMAAEAETLLQRVAADEHLVLLDERGKSFGSRQLANQLQGWLNDGRDLVFLIGGPDGVADQVRQRAESTWSLSALTLPHGLARVLCIEQLYRAYSLLHGHPYHRE